MTTLSAERAQCLDGLRALQDAIEAFENTVDMIVDGMPIGYASRALPTILMLEDELGEEGMAEIHMAMLDLGVDK